MFPAMTHNSADLTADKSNSLPKCKNICCKSHQSCSNWLVFQTFKAVVLEHHKLVIKVSASSLWSI